MDTLALDSNVSQLVRVQKRMVRRDDGRKQWTDYKSVPSLLDQLRGACKPGQEAGSGGGSDLKAPVALNALDLLVDITATAREFRAFYATERGTVEGDIQAWAAHCRTDEQAVDAAERITSKWVSEIENLFDPPKRQHVKAACPACEARYKYSQEAGETVRGPALQVTVLEGAQSYAECGACGARWERGQMHLLAEVLKAS